MYAYRLFRVDDNGNPEVLFHPFPHSDGKRSRKVPLDETLNAEIGQVWNPGKKGNGPGFVSGWHSTPGMADAVGYLQNFKDHSRMAVARVMIDGNVRSKPRSRANVLLSDTMVLTSKDWQERITE